MDKVPRLSVIFMLFLFSCSSIPKENSFSFYKKTYDYLNKRHENLIVSDSIFNIDLTIFSDKIAKNKKVDLIKILDSLTLVQNSNTFNSYNYSLSRKLNLEKNKEINNKAFFSKLIDNRLLVEVHGTEKDMYYSQVTFGCSDIYLFEFENSNIVSIDSIKVDYN